MGIEFGSNWTVGDYIYKKRTEKGMSGRELASAAGIHHATISGYETGRRQPDIINCLKLARALDVDPFELMSFVKEQSMEEGAIGIECYNLDDQEAEFPRIVYLSEVTPDEVKNCLCIYTDGEVMLFSRDNVDKSKIVLVKEKGKLRLTEKKDNTEVEKIAGFVRYIEE